jgi:hypothetical protein
VAKDRADGGDGLRFAYVGVVLAAARVFGQDSRGEPKSPRTWALGASGVHGRRGGVGGSRIPTAFVLRDCRNGFWLLAFGFWTGLAIAQTATLAGNYLVYLAARTGIGKWAQAHMTRRERLRSLVKEEGLRGVLLARQLPVPGLAINLTCGAFRVRTRDFLAGTLIANCRRRSPAL